ncbi:tetratricopeptide repeat-containing glycosyltransferase family protein [Acetobacteraceae bacterium KSS8]|uniref:Tetratricopeptide repeat-containing glycosyltransferase family protein n=1 Tax=Endosaccharibacter trunci TaxID=2812733 RepID=A0ABT1W9U6_9PROT|nr:tetratricopeptide repeat-containing glycosyltransferase family protein [Acetobacteraceae bacterium KSS8]
MTIPAIPQDDLAGAIAAGLLEAAIAAAGLDPVAAPAQGWRQLGLFLARTNRATLAIPCFQHSLSFDPNQAACLSALCVLLMRTHRLAEAVRAGEQAVALQPNDPAFLDNLALALADAGRVDEARICLIRAIGLAPDRAESHLSLAQLLLSIGEMQPGWLEYEWRNRTEMARNTVPETSAASWNGMRMPHGRLIVICDQGYGDTLQFARYLPHVAALCPDLHLCVSPPLKTLLDRVPGPVALHTRWEDVPPHAAVVRLSSLPFLFRTELDTIPSAAGYLRAGDAARARWAMPAGGPAGRLRVGLVWAGRDTHPNDMRRSIPLSALLPLADQTGVCFVCLQRPVPAADQGLLDRFGMEDLSARLESFDDTAALIETLDLVIAVDTSTAHLAGALGRPCWLMLGHPPDWRWLLSGSTTPWYDSITLFRQPAPGDWAGTIGAVAARLTALLATPLTTPVATLLAPTATDER